MGRQIVERDLLCGEVDWKPALEKIEIKKYIYRSCANRS